MCQIVILLPSWHGPSQPMMRSQSARTALAKIDLKSTSKTVLELAESLSRSANHRNSCPEISETRNQRFLGALETSLMAGRGLMKVGVSWPS